MQENNITPEERNSNTTIRVASPVSQENYSQQWRYGEVIKKFFRLGIPFSAMRFTDVAIEIVGGFLFVQLGPRYLAANGLIIPMQRFLITTCTAVLFAMGVPLRQNKNNPEEIGALVRQGVALALFLSIFPIAIASCAGPLLHLLRQDVLIANTVQDFYFTALPSIPCAIISAVFQQFTLGIERPNVSLVFNIANSILACGAGSIFTLGLFGMPRLCSNRP